MDLSTAETRDSQDACLVGSDQSFAEMLRERFGGESIPGPIVDDDGRVLGQHRGVHHFTVGQRRALFIPSTSRLWVRAIRADDAAVVVTDSEQRLYRDHLVATDVSWLAGESPPRRGMDCEVQVRYRHAAEAARIETSEAGAVSVAFRRPVRAITPGQAAVFYDGARVLGKGWIHACG